MRDSGYVYMDTFCFNQIEIILINETECIIYRNAKSSDRVDVCIYMLQASVSDLIF